MRDNIRRNAHRFWQGIERSVNEISPSLGDGVKKVGRLGKAAQNAVNSPLGKRMQRAIVGSLKPGLVGLVSMLTTDPERRPVSESELKPGDHLWRDGKFLHPAVDGVLTPYTHHGLYVGSGRVIHFGENGKDKGERVCEVCLSDFAEGRPIFCRDSLLRYSPTTVIQRARSRMGEADYRLFMNNCEHFVEWCRNGD